MMRLLVCAACAAALLAPTGCGGSGENGEEEEGASASRGPEPVTVELAELNSSGRSGIATISEGAGGSIDVTVEMDDHGPGLPVIHGFVPCNELGEHPERGPVYRLEPLVDGRSETNLKLPVQEGKALFQVATGGHFFAVHERTSADRVVACGAIPFR